MKDHPDSDDLLRVTLASIGDAVITTDTRGDVTYLNAVAEHLTGWTVEQATGERLETVFNIVNEYSREPVANPVEKVLREGRIAGLANHTVLIARDGTERPIDDSAAPILDDDEQLRGAVLVFRDITERKQAEAAAEVHNRLVTARADVATSLATAQPLQAGLQSCCEALVEHLEMAFARIWIVDDAGSVLNLQASAGLYTHLDGGHSCIRLGEYKIGRIAESRQPHLTNEVMNDPNISDPEWAEREGMVAFAGYPLVVDDEVVGVLGMFSRKPLPEVIMDDLMSVTDQIARYVVHKRGEQRLRESEQRYRLIGQAANDAIWDWDLVTNQVVWNEGVQSRFGFTAEEVGKDASWWYEQIHPQDRERVVAGIHAVIDGSGEFWQEDYRYRRADGSFAEVVDRGRVLRDEQGAAIRMVGSMRDLTERRQVEAELREREERLRMAVESADIGTWDFDPTTGALQWNSRCKAIFGLDPDTEVDYDVFLAALHPDDRDLADGAVQQALDPAGSGAYQVDYRVVWPDGAVKWIVARGQGFFEGTGPDRRAIRFIGTALDVTERKQAEQTARQHSQQLQRLADVATRLGVAHDIDSVLGIVTEEARRVVESHQSVGSITVGADWQQAITKVSLSDRYAEWRNYEEPPDGSGIYRVVCQANRPMRMTQAELEAHPAWKGFSGAAADHPPMRGWLAAPFVGRDGRNLGLIQLSDKCEGEFTADDEAVVVQLAQMASVAIENARLVENLRDADRRKDEFLATLAHELRNPLAPIRMGLTVLRHRSHDTAAREEICETMERQTEQLIMLVDDLLDVSRITRGKLELRKRRVEISEVIQSAVEASRPFVQEADHELTVDLPESPIVVHADPHRLAQVISNLLTNAARYTPPRGRIQLEARQVDGEAVVSVIDNGIGIPYEMQQAIFEMFTQIRRPMERSDSGLGIGLMLVKSLMNMHGGTVELDSEGTGHGCEFRIRLPVNIEPPAAESAEGEVEESAAGSGRRVLVVDDNRAAAEMLGKVLSLLGHEVLTAHDGRQAIDMAAGHLPEVILMDLGMPQMSGYEAARGIRDTEWGRSMTLIALTGWGQAEDRQRTREAGFDHHLVKPADPTEIQRLLTLSDADEA